jgi:hypothetical protein
VSSADIARRSGRSVSLIAAEAKRITGRSSMAVLEPHSGQTPRHPKDVQKRIVEAVSRERRRGEETSSSDTTA